MCVCVRARKRVFLLRMSAALACLFLCAQLCNVPTTFSKHVLAVVFDRAY